MSESLFEKCDKVQGSNFNLCQTEIIMGSKIHFKAKAKQSKKPLVEISISGGAEYE